MSITAVDRAAHHDLRACLLCHKAGSPRICGRIGQMHNCAALDRKALACMCCCSLQVLLQILCAAAPARSGGPGERPRVLGGCANITRTDKGACGRAHLMLPCSSQEAAPTCIPQAWEFRGQVLPSPSGSHTLVFCGMQDCRMGRFALLRTCQRKRRALLQFCPPCARLG